MTATTENSIPAPVELVSRSGRNDPLLQELWHAKAMLNASADYNIDRLVARAVSFDLDAELIRLPPPTIPHV
jgi:hypothetical protein